NELIYFVHTCVIKMCGQSRLVMTKHPGIYAAIAHTDTSDKNYDSCANTCHHSPQLTTSLPHHPAFYFARLHPSSFHSLSSAHNSYRQFIARLHSPTAD